MNVDEFNPVLYSVIKQIGNLFITNKELGVSSSSKVYLGYIDKQSNAVAVKIFSRGHMSEKNKKYFEREIVNLSILGHENICGIMMHLASASNYYLAIELCKKGTLKEYMTGKVITNKLIYDVLSQLINGFRILFFQRIIHRAIKPENILITDKDQIKISDFGYSKCLDDMEVPIHQTYTNQNFYSSLEIIENKPYSSKCDVYSLGVVLYELIYKKLPFNLSPKNNKIQTVLNSNPSLIFPEEPVISEHLKSLIENMLVIIEEKRYSWPQVFESYEEIKNTSLIDVKLIISKETKPEKENFAGELKKMKFFSHCYKLIYYADPVQVLGNHAHLILRIRFCLFIIHSHMNRSLKKDAKILIETKKLEGWESLLNDADENYKEMLSYYYLDLRNPYLTEMNEALNYSNTSPELNDKGETVLLYKEKLNELFAEVKLNYSFFESSIELLDILLCLKLLKELPKFIHKNVHQMYESLQVQTRDEKRLNNLKNFLT